MSDPRSFAVVTYLALGPGLVGHTGYNSVLRYVSPLAVSISLTMEPLFGSVLGMAHCRPLARRSLLFFAALAVDKRLNSESCTRGRVFCCTRCFFEYNGDKIRIDVYHVVVYTVGHSSCGEVPVSI